MSDNPLEKMFGVANPPPGKKYDFTAVEGWMSRGGAGFGFSWLGRGMGFGQVYFEVGPDGQVHIDTEYMSDDFLKEMLCFMVDNAAKDGDLKTWKTRNDYWQEGYSAPDGTQNPYSPEDQKGFSAWEAGYRSGRE